MAQVMEEEQAQMEIMLEIPLTVWKTCPSLLYTPFPGRPGFFTLSRAISYHFFSLYHHNRLGAALFV